MRIRFLLRSLIVPAAVVIAACGSDIITSTPPVTDPALATFASQLNIDLATFTLKPSGLYIKDVPAGWGAIVADSGDTVTVDYSGFLVDGYNFDASRRRGAAAQFILVPGQLVKGFEEGIKGMRVGGKRRLIIPPALGYGITGSGEIPPNAILIFDVTLHGIR